MADVAPAPTEAFNKHTTSALDELSTLSPLYQHGSVSLLLKVLTAVVTSPSESRFRRINAVKLLPKLRTRAGLKLLESIGFHHATNEVTAKNPDEEDFMTMEKQPTEEEIKTIKSVCEKLNGILANTASAGASASAGVSSTAASSPLFQARAEDGDTTEDDQFVFFSSATSWGSQSSHAPFVVEGVTYLTLEQWIEASKARRFGDHATFARIMTSASPREHARFGRRVVGFVEAEWANEALQVCVQGCLAKFSQQADFAQRLLATGTKTLIFASPLDPFWGVALDASHADIRAPEKWPGKNRLGVALEQARTALRAK